MSKKRIDRILIKLSGESLMGNEKYGISIDTVNAIAKNLNNLLLKKTQILYMPQVNRVFHRTVNLLKCFSNKHIENQKASNFFF